MDFLKRSFLFLQSKTPGARTLKTGIAMSVSMFICELLNIPSPILAGAATISNMQPGTGESLKNAKNQALAHVIAIITAIIFGFFFGPSPLIIGIVTIVVITICINLKIETSIHVAIIAAIFILYSPGSDYLHSALQRTAAIFIGIFVAFLINVTILPPENEKRLKKELIELHKSVGDFLEESINNYLLIQNTRKEDFENTSLLLEEKIETARSILETYKAEIEIESAEKKKREDFYDKYLNYQKILMKNINDIYSLSERRRDRVFGKKAGIPEEYFSEINSFLVQLFSDFQKWNDQVIKKVKEEPLDYPDLKDFWDVFNEKIISQYNSITEKQRFIPTIIEVSIVVYKMKWITEEAKKAVINNVQAGEYVNDF